MPGFATRIVQICFNADQQQMFVFDFIDVFYCMTIKFES